MIAYSGTYKTEAEYGTLPKHVKPICGQSTSRSLLTVVHPENEATWLARNNKCKKCFGA